MDRMIYEVTAKCPPDYKSRGHRERTYHASIEKEEQFHHFTFLESWREMDRKRFTLEAGFTLVTSIGTFLVLEAWKENPEKEIHPNPVHCRAVLAA